MKHETHTEWIERITAEETEDPSYPLDPQAQKLFMDYMRCPSDTEEEEIEEARALRVLETYLKLTTGRPY